MRYYVRKEDLILTLNELTRKKNQKVVSIYKDVMMYRFSNHPQDFSHVEKALMMPRRLILAFVNFLLACVAIWMLPGLVMSLESLNLKILIPSILYIFAGSQAITAWRIIRTLKAIYPYVVIDELLARKIIILSPKKKSVKEIKTAK